MNKERSHRDQAEKLRQKIDERTFEEGQIVEREELPPRSRVHHQKRKKNKWRLKYPVIRLLVLFFLLLPVTIFSIYSIMLDKPVSDVRKTIGETSDGFEVIDIETSVPKENQKEEEEQPDQELSERQEEQGDTGTEAVEVEGNEENGTENTSGENSSVSIDSIVSDTKSEQNQYIYHTVQAGETIYRISMKYYKSKAGIDTIKRANGLSSNEIRVGQVLTIPLTK